ncbi:hypothetical protein OSB04_022875 [Centaurea solstitialis]|uniref:histidine kinase n=1 Tax=Centaurea solstitialis TaxID=347529 RepID=A0AA38SQK6_9ASTR|nr:hypothetical protein OSB04_022875 [Centaurea solstitialis]
MARRIGVLPPLMTTTKTCMKLNKMIKPRPFSCFILLALIGLLLSTSFIPFGVLKIKQVEQEVDLITKKSHQEIWSLIQSSTTSLLPMNSSAKSLAKFVNISLSETDIAFSEIQPKVAPLLFQALLTIPHVSQISYIRQDGMFLALYFNDHNQIFAIYSNTSFSKATEAKIRYSWYTQPVSSDTGKLYGEAVLFPPRLLVNETWLQKTANGFASSLGKALNDVNNLVVMNTAGVDKNGVISLGFDLKSLMNVFVGVKSLGGGLYLATKDGKVLTEGIPNTRMVLDRNGSISFQLLKANGDQSGSIALQLNDETPQAHVLDISGTKYVLYSSSIDIIGLQAVCVLALPYGGLPSMMHKDIKSVFVLLSVTFVTIPISIFAFLVLTMRASRREMCLRAALIKQKEATQQAERFSNNHSLAFANASHDIRTFLAGIDGTLDLIISDNIQGSELVERLTTIKDCSLHLCSLLNSILDTSKIESGKIELEEKQLDLANLLEGVVDLFYPVGLKKKVDVILDLQDGSLTKFSLVKGDEGRLKQILANLLSNAIKFTSDGYVSVRASVRKPRLQNSGLNSTHDQPTRWLSCFFFKKDGDFEAMDEIIRHDPNSMEFIFEVNDTGKGIPKEKQASVFENYVQVKETDPEIEGTGLGLGIVRALVRLMGGEITIVDKEVGEKGTCFRFNVILKVCRSDLSEDEKSVSPGYLSAGSNTPSRNHKRQDRNRSTVVLFISGDERRKMTQNFLSSQGVKVVAVKTAQQLSQTLKEFRRDRQTVCSSRSDLNLSFGYLTWPTSRDSNVRSREVPLSSMDGIDDASPTRTTDNVSSFLLLAVDTTSADFRELCKTVAEFRKDSNDGGFRVVWLGSRYIHRQGLDEKELPPSDSVIPMPFHGSRLYSLIDLLPEFGGKFLNSPSHRNQHHPPSGQPETQEIAQISPPSPLRGKRVLLAEDDAVQETIAKKILSKHGVSIETCGNGKEAFDKVSKGLNDQRDLGASHILPYEYILMDYQMPVMDGCEATRQIRSMEKEYGVHTPIIGLTAHTEGKELNRFFAAGIDIHVSKPLNERKVLKAIEDLHSKK